MAQIIKHRRGSLESVASATKRAGELLVVTGSAGITATNGNSILFVGIDGSTVTPANKILQGTSVPDLSGASYDTSVDGIPFYNTSTQKLYILNKGGNVEIKATANTGGTGIVSGSSQITPLLPIGTVSGSSQITISSTTGYSTFSSSLDSRLVTISTNVTELFSTASDHESRIDTIETSIGGGSGIGLRVTNLETYTGSQDAKNITLASYTASVTNDLTALHTFTSSQETKNSTLATYTGSINSDLSALHTYTASVTSDLTALHTFTASQESKNSTIATYTGSVNSDLSALHTFTSSQESKNSTLATYTGSVTSNISAIHEFTASQVNQNAKLATTGSNIFQGNQTITGSLYITNNLVVQGSSSLQNITASAVDIGTNVVKLNTSTPAVRFGGVSVQDSGSNAGVSGSLLWDSFNNRWLYVQASGSGEGYNSAILIAGPKNTGTIGDEATLTSGSIQVALGEDHIGDSIITQNVGATKITIGGGLDVTGTISGSIEGIGNVAVYSASVDSRLDSVEASLGGGGSIGTRVSALEAYTSSQDTKNSTLASYTGSIDTKFSTLATYTGSIDGKISQLIADSGSQAGRITALEIKSSSLDTKFTTLASYTGSVDTTLTNLNSFSSSINTTIKTKLNVEGVISGSSQVSYTGLSNIPAGIVSGSSQLNSTTINALRVTSGELSGSFNGTFVGDGSGLTGIASTLALSGSTGNDTVNLKTEALLVTGSNGVSTAVTNNTITISGTDASTTAKGVASFSSTNFAVTTGNVTIKAGGVTATTLNANVAGTGISLNGVDNSIEVDYGSTAGTAVEGNTSLTIQGTSNEIEISGGSVTLGSGGTVTIGLPNSVTIPTASIQNNLSVGGNVSVTGNLYVQGTTTTIDSTTISLGDNIIELNGSAAANGGLLVRDVTAPNTVSGSLLWDTTNDYWKGGALGSEKQFARLNATPTSGSVQVIGASGLLVDSHITDAGTNVTITSDLVINGLTANAFVVSNGSKKLISVAPSNAGDLIQWNGSSFVASNEIDGGTF